MRENFILIITVIIFIAGLYFCLNYKGRNIIVGFESSNKNKEGEEKSQCPDILIQEAKAHLN